jgi:hypothetical protein
MLKRSNNSKVANLVVNGSSKVANAFGLPAGLTCRGMTGICKGDDKDGVCYAGRLERLRPNVRRALMHNYDALLKCNDSTDEMQTLLQAMVDEFKKDCDKHGAPKLFRIHWDGDFFSDNYAKAWSRVVNDNADVKFWVYTRDESAAMIIHGSRATLYFSADDENRELATRMADQGILIAYLGNTFPEARDGYNEVGVGSSVKCPENNKKIPLISESQSACVACGVCIYGRNNVLFSVNKNRMPKKALELVAT